MSDWADYCDGLVAAGWPFAAITQDLRQRGFDPVAADQAARAAFERVAATRPAAAGSTSRGPSARTLAVALSVPVLAVGVWWLLNADPRFERKTPWLVGTSLLVLFGIASVVRPGINSMGRTGRGNAKLMGADGAKIFTPFLVACVSVIGFGIGLGALPEGPSEAPVRGAAGCEAERVRVESATRAFLAERRRLPIDVAELRMSGHLERDAVPEADESWQIDGDPEALIFGVGRCRDS